MPRKRNSPPREDHATKAIYELRVQSIVQIILDGAETWDVLQFVSEQQKEGKAPWTLGKVRKPLSERQIRNYIADANKRIVQAGEQAAVDGIKHHIAKRRSLYARAVNAGDLRTALAILADLAQLEDFYPAKKTEQKNTGEMVIKIEADDDFYRNADRLESAKADGAPTASPE